MKTHAISLSAILWLAGSSLTTGQATELVYTPVNPAFGGNPLNGSWMLNNAQAQNDHTSSSASLDAEQHHGAGALFPAAGIAAADPVAPRCAERSDRLRW